MKMGNWISGNRQVPDREKLRGALDVPWKARSTPTPKPLRKQTKASHKCDWLWFYFSASMI